MQKARAISPAGLWREYDYHVRRIEGADEVEVELPDPRMEYVDVISIQSLPLPCRSMHKFHGIDGGSYSPAGAPPRGTEPT